MSNDNANQISAPDRQRLCDLKKRVGEIAHSPVNEERRRLWKKHAAFQGERPMVLAEHGGVPNMIPASAFKCTGDRARGMEEGLLNTIFRFEEIGDDHVVEPYVTYNWHVSVSDYGVQAKTERGASDGNLFGSYRWEAPIKDLDRDFDKIHPRTFSVNRESTMKAKAEVEAFWDGIFPTHRRGGYWWTMGMTWPAISLVGLDGLMVAMMDNPRGVHRLMAFLRDDHMAFAKWLEKEGLLNLNNENDYVGSGSEGYTHELPQRDWKDSSPVRLKDLWVLSESQETVGVSPAMFAEFIFPYQRDLIEEFGLCYYGCCEPVHSRMKTLTQLSNLRRVSVSPWCDQEQMAEWCGKRITFCRKPAPSLISTPQRHDVAISSSLLDPLCTALTCPTSL